MKKDNLEDLFKESFENFEADVNPGVWKNVQTAMKGAGLGFFGKMLLNRIGTNTLVAIVSSAATVVGTVLVMNGHKAESTAPKKDEASAKVVAEAVKPSVNEIKDFLDTKDSKNASSMKESSSKNEEETAVQIPSKEESALAIRKDKMNDVINDYESNAVANIYASPIAGAAPLIIDLANNGSGKTNKWDFGDGTKEAGTNPVHLYDEPGIYTVILTSTNSEGKVSSDSVTIEVVRNSVNKRVPGDFSPNGDGVKDDFTFDSKNISAQNVVVFDKNKTVVYKSDGLSPKWDGNDLRGKPVKDGEYFYVQKAEGKDGKKYEQSGKITLKR
ncbi:MAG: PKD domain-containing protein [Bacteroidia bacterium]